MFAACSDRSAVSDQVPGLAATPSLSAPLALQGVVQAAEPDEQWQGSQCYDYNESQCHKP